MMAFNFPDTPTVGQVFQRYAWDGEKWIVAAGGTAMPPVLWLPSQLSTLKLWFKGDSNTGANGSTVTTWADSSGFASNATGMSDTGGSVPTVAAANLNGLNVVRINETTKQYFTVPNVLTGSAAGSAIWVVKLNLDPPTGTAGGVTKFGSDLSTTGDNHYAYPDGSGTVYDDFGNAARRNLGGRPGSFAVWHMASMHAAASDFRMYINGVSFYSTASNTVSWCTTPRIGKGLSSNLVNYIDCWLAELIFVNEVLSTADRQNLEGYLAYKWGIQSVLNVAHPYKSTPPVGGSSPPPPVLGPPLDAVASVTGAWSFGRNMLTSFGAGTRYTKASGSFINQLMDQTGNSRHFVQNTTGNQPVEAAAFPNNVVCANFDGVNDYMAVGGNQLANLITASTGAVVVSVIINTVTLNNATSFNNHCVFDDGAQFIGLYARNLGGVTLYAFNWDGNADNATTTTTVGTPCVLMWRHDGGNIYISINGGTEIVAASGNTTNLGANYFYLGGDANYCDCKIAEIFTTNNGGQTAALAAAIANMKTYVGA